MDKTYRSVNHVPFKLEERFHWNRLQAQDKGKKRETLSALSRVLKNRLKQIHNEGQTDAFAAGRQIISALCTAEHALFSWGYDGENIERWSFDYMQKGPVASLFIEVHRNWDVKCDWVERWQSGGALVFLQGVCRAN